MNSLFTGELVFANLTFNSRDQNFDLVTTISGRDLSTILNFATQAVIPISQYASQYGANGISVNQNVLSYEVNLTGLSFDDAALKEWVSEIVNANQLDTSTCVIILLPPGISNSSWSPGTGGEHYHDAIPYILSSVAGTFDVNGNITLKDLAGNPQNLTVQDTFFSFAGSLSHEIAEMTVNPFGGNPEVCDACGPNFNSTYLNYFDFFGNYIGTTQTPPYNVNFSYNFYLNGIATPPFALQAKAPASACSYFPYGKIVDPASLLCVKRMSTGTGTVEIHILTGDSSYQVFSVQKATPLSIPDAVNFDFISGSGADLFCIKKINTGSQSIEVHILSAGSNYNNFSLQQPAALSRADAVNFDFAIDGSGNLFCIKKTNTGSGFMEVHILTSASSYQQFSLHAITPLTQTDAANFKFAASGNGDLLCMKITNTGTGNLEVHVLSAALGYTQFSMHTETPITSSDAANFDFGTDPNLNLLCIKRTNTGSNSLEVHVLSAVSLYRIFLLHTGTPISQADATNFSFATGE